MHLAHPDVAVMLFPGVVVDALPGSLAVLWLRVFTLALTISYVGKTPCSSDDKDRLILAFFST